jgi:hypothetical protein
VSLDCLARARSPSSFAMNGRMMMTSRRTSVAEQTNFWSPRSTQQLSDFYYSDTLAAPISIVVSRLTYHRSLACFSATNYAFSKFFGVDCICSTCLCIYYVLCYACSTCTYPILDHAPHNCNLSSMVLPSPPGPCVPINHFRCARQRSTELEP